MKPGVEPSETPGSKANQFRARETGDSGNDKTCRTQAIYLQPSLLSGCRPLRRLSFSVIVLGFPYASPQGGVPGRASRLACETLCLHLLRRFEEVCFLTLSELA